MPKKTDDLAARARAYFRALERGKRAYAKADELVGKLALELEPGHEIDLGPESGKAVLIDKFAVAKANKKYINPTLWQMAGARQYELELRR